MGGDLTSDLNPDCPYVNATDLGLDKDQNASVNGAYEYRLKAIIIMCFI